MSENFSEDYLRSHAYGLASLDNQIADHKREDETRSVLSWAASRLWDSDSSLKDLEELSAKAHKAKDSGNTAEFARLQSQFCRKIDDDIASRDWTNEVAHYGSGFAKTVPLFVSGKHLLKGSGGIGLAATVAMYGLDRASLSDNGTDFAKKFALGGMEGGLLKTTFFGIEKLRFENESLQALVHSPAFKGMTIGMAGRGISATVDATLDPKTASFADGFRKVSDTMLDGRAVAMDMALFTTAHGMMRGANWLTGKAFDARPMYQTVGTSTTFGLTNGAFHEYERQLKAGEAPDYKKILARAAVQGTIDAFAGIPGGFVADPAFRRRPLATLAEDARTAKHNAGVLMDRATNGLNGIADQVSASMTPRGPEFAFAFAVAGDGPRPVMGRPSSIVPERLYMSVTGPDGVAGSGGGGRIETPAVKPVLATGEAEVRKEASGRGPTEAEKTRPAEVERPGITRPLTPSEQTAQTLLEPFKKGLASRTDVKSLYEFLAKNKDVDKYIGQIYQEHFDNLPLRHAIEGFYKPIPTVHTEPLLANEAAAPLIQQLRRYLESSESKLSAKITGAAFKNFIKAANDLGIDLTPAMHHLGRINHSELIVGAVDIALGNGSDYLGLLKAYKGDVRSLPVTDAEIAAAAKRHQIVQDVKSGQSKLPQAEILPGDGRTRFIGPDGGEISADIVAKAQLARDAAVESAVAKMQSGEPVSTRIAVNDLAMHLDHPSAQTWYPEWRALAEKNIVLGSILSSHSVLALGDNPVRELLSSSWPNSPKNGTNAAEQLRNKLYMLQSLGERFINIDATTGAVSGAETAIKLLEAAKTQPEIVKGILDQAAGNKGGETYKNWVAARLQAGADVSTLSGDGALTSARLAKALSGRPELVSQLESLAAADGSFNLALLAEKMTFGKMAPKVIELVLERAKPGATAADLNPERLLAEVDIKNAFGQNPAAVERLILLSKAEQAQQPLKEILTDPFAAPRGSRRPPPGAPKDPVEQANRSLGFAYKDIVAALAPQAKTIGQLNDVMSALKNRGLDRAFDLIHQYDMVPPPDLMVAPGQSLWNRVQLQMSGVSARDATLLPERLRTERNDRGDQRSQRPSASPVTTGSDGAKTIDGSTVSKPVLGEFSPGPSTGEAGLKSLVNEFLTGSLPPGSEQTVAVAPSRVEPAVLASTEAAGAPKIVAMPKIETLTAGESTKPAVVAPEKTKVVEPPKAVESPAAPVELTDQHMEGFVRQLTEGMPPEKRAAARALAENMERIDDEAWFDAWRAAAPDLLPYGLHLRAPGVPELRAEVLYKALIEDQVEPSTAGARPSQKVERLDARLNVIGTAGEAFKDHPGLLAKVLEIGSGDLATVREVVFKAKHPQHGKVYAEQLNAALDAGAKDLRAFAGPKAIEEARVRKALAPIAEDASQENHGSKLVEAATAGQVDLSTVLEHLNNPEFGSVYRNDVREALAKGDPDLARFGRKTYINEMRVRELLKHEPVDGEPAPTVDMAETVAQAAAAGTITPRQLELLIKNLLNPYCGERYAWVLKASAQIDGNDPIAVATDEYMYTAARTWRTFENNPEVGDWLVANSVGTPQILKDLMNGAPRDRALQTGYSKIIEALVPQAENIQQVEAVMKAVLAKKGDAAFDAASDIRPTDDATWTTTRKLIDLVSKEDSAGVQELLPRPPRFEGRGGGGRSSGGGNSGSGGGQTRGDASGTGPAVQTEPGPDFSQLDVEGGKQRRKRGGKDPRDVRRQNRDEDW